MRWLGVAIVLLLHTAPLQAQDLVTIRADSLSAGERDGLPVEQLFGHVQFVQGPLYGSADRAIRYTTLGKIELTGNVEIHQDTLSLYAPSVTYDGISQVGYAEGGIRLTDRDVVVHRELGIEHHHRRHQLGDGRGRPSGRGPARRKTSG